ncbi:rhamnan synthesis F family protein, partial [Streptococcus parasanguinis]
MQRLLLYVHYNKFNFISGHVLYQLEKIRPLYSRVVFISNSQLPEDVKSNLVAQHLVDDILERKNSGFDFAAWRD